MRSTHTVEGVSPIQDDGTHWVTPRGHTHIAIVVGETCETMTIEEWYVRGGHSLAMPDEGGDDD